MKRILLLATLALLSVGLVAAPVSAAVPPDYTPRGIGDTYLALGDSLVTGTEVIANDDGLGGYPDLLAERLREQQPDLRYINLGRSGETSYAMRYGTRAVPSQLSQAVAVIAAEQAAGRRVGLVTVSIGGNDMWQLLPPPLGVGNLNPERTLEQFADNLRHILDELQAALTADGVPQGDVILMTYYYPYPGLDALFGDVGLTQAWLDRFNGVIQAEVAQRGIPVAEVAAAFVGNEPEYLYVRFPYVLFTINPLRDFDFHPRPAGHRAIADEYWAVSGY